jgi:F0F1-type ATP synthase assembly protein I
VKLKQILKTVAPVLGMAVGGPFGPIAGKLLADALGEKPPANEGAMEALVQKAMADPALIVKLKEVDAQLETRLKELGVDIAKVEAEMQRTAVDNTKDARAMQVANKAKTPAILSAVVVIGNFAVIGYLLGWGTPQGLDPMLLGRLLGTLDIAFGIVLNFWLGSSHGSRSKDAAAQK